MIIRFVGPLRHDCWSWLTGFNIWMTPDFAGFLILLLGFGVTIEWERQKA